MTTTTTTRTATATVLPLPPAVRPPLPDGTFSGGKPGGGEANGALGGSAALGFPTAAVGRPAGGGAAEGAP